MTTAVAARMPRTDSMPVTDRLIRAPAMPGALACRREGSPFQRARAGCRMSMTRTGWALPQRRLSFITAPPGQPDVGVRSSATCSIDPGPVPGEARSRRPGCRSHIGCPRWWGSLLVPLPQDRCLARLGPGARVVALTSAAHARSCGSHLACVDPGTARAGRGSRGVCSARSSGALPARQPHRIERTGAEAWSEVLSGS